MKWRLIKKYGRKRKMDNFDERKKKELFEKASEKQLAYAKRTLLLVFLLIGAIILIMGLILIFCNVQDEEGFLVGIVFAPLGAFLMLLGLILRIALPRSYSYESYKKRMEKYGCYMNTYDMYITIELLEERIKELEKKVQELE